MRLAADDEVDPCALGCGTCAHVAHGDWAADRRAVTAAGDDAEGRAVGADQRCLIPRRRPALGPDTDAPTRGPGAQLLLDVRGTGKPALLAPALADRPDEIGLDRRRRAIDVMAVEAQPGFQAQAVAGAKADRL